MSAGSDNRPDETHEEDRADETPTWFGRGWTLGYGWPSLSRPAEDGGPVVDEGPYDGTDTAVDRDDGGSWWDEGLITLLLVAGVVLFLFPEPATSALGIVLLAVGVIAWVVDALT